MKTSEPWLSQAWAHFDRGRLEDCIGAIHKGQAANPEDFRFLTLLTRCYVRQRKAREAMKSAQQAIKMSPDHPESHIALTLALWSNRRIDEALKTVASGLQTHPNEPTFFELQSRMLAAKGKWKDSLKAAEQGLTLRPNSPVLAELKGTALSRLGRTDEAHEVLANAIADNPDKASTLEQMGWNELRKGRFSQAAKLFQDALRNDPNRSRARLGLLECLRAMVPPYRAVAKFNDRMRGLGSGFVIGPWVIIVMLRSGAIAAGASAKNFPPVIGLTIIAVLVVFALLRPISQCFVLFHPVGHDALFPAERAIAAWFLGWFVFSAVSLTLLLTVHNDDLPAMLWPSFAGAFAFALLSYTRDTSRKALLTAHVLGGVCSVLAIGAIAVGLLHG